MERSALLFAALGLVACSGGDKDNLDTSDTGPQGCTNEITGYSPFDGQTDAYYRAAVEVMLKEADAAATITLADADGNDVAGTLSASESGKIIYFQPDVSLASNTDYVASFSICDGEKNPTISFHTSELGEATTADLVGNTYNLDITKARFVEPAGVAELLLGQLENSILVGINSTDANVLSVIGALSADGSDGQDFCSPSLDFPEADYTEAPFFNIGPQDTDIAVGGYDLSISALQISGTFSADGSYFGGGVMSGQLDARILAPLLVNVVGTDDPDEICVLLAGFGANCTPCSSDGEEYCINILADQMTAELQDGSLECVAGEDCHELCDLSAKNKECDTSNYPVCD